MAGSIRYVRYTGVAETDLRACVNAVNRLIADFDAHTHTGATGPVAAVTTARQIADALDKVVHLGPTTGN